MPPAPAHQHQRREDVIDAFRANRVEVREIDVSFSFAQNTLEEGEGKYCAVRLGFRQIDGFNWVDEDEERLKRSRAAFRKLSPSFRGAPLGASPESITTIGSMDSGLSLRSPRNDEAEVRFGSP